MRITTPNDTNQEELDPHYAVVDALPREATRFPGVEISTLRREVASGLRAHLVHMRTAAVLLGHEHLAIDVLSGSLIDDQSSVSVGIYVWHLAGKRHAACAPEGALRSGVFLEPIRFFTSLKPR